MPQNKTALLTLSLPIPLFLGFEEGGVPIGACLLTEEGKVIGRGHNMRVQKSSATLHGETSCFENAGRLPASVYKKCTVSIVRDAET